MLFDPHTVLMFAVQGPRYPNQTTGHRHVEVVQVLIRAGVDVNARIIGGPGWTVLESLRLTRGKWSRNMEQILIRAGAYR